MDAFLPVNADEVFLADVHLSYPDLIVRLLTEAKAFLAALLQFPVWVFNASETAALVTAQTD